MANQPLNQLLSITQGVTAQTWAAYPPAMAENDTTLGNVNDVVAPGDPNPEDARPGYLAAGQPQGANVVIIPDTDANGATGGNLQTVGAPAGTAGGGGYYPGPVNPMIAPGWTAQANANEDAPAELVVTTTAFSGPAGTAGDTTAPGVSGGVSPYTFSVLSALPTGITLSSASTGVLAIATTAVAGTYEISMKVVDSTNFEGSADKEAEFVQSIVLTPAS